MALRHFLAVTEPKWELYPTGTVADERGMIVADPRDLNGEVTLRELVARVRPKVVLGIGRPEQVAHLCYAREEREFKLILYLKVDDFPIPAHFAARLLQADRIITMGCHSSEGIRASNPSEIGGEAEYLYCPADAARFLATTGVETSELREALLPDWIPHNGFILGWVGWNRWRKQVWLLYEVLHYLRTGKYLVCRACERVSLMAWDPATRRHGDESDCRVEGRPGYRYEGCEHCGSREVERAEPLRDLFLWLHMPQDDPSGAWPLHWLEEQWDVRPGRDLYYTEGYGMKGALPPEDMPTLYQLWDGLLYLSGSEGFGLPAWEAMGCGLPVVYSNAPGHAEYLNAAGAGLPVGGRWQPERKTGHWRMIADAGEAVAAARRLYYDRELGRRLGARGRAYVEDYSVEKQAKRWHEIFTEVLEERGGKE